MRGVLGDPQKWQLKLRRLVRRIKNKDGSEYDYLDLDMILTMMLEDYKSQRFMFQRDMQKNFTRSVEAVSGTLDLD